MTEHGTRRCYVSNRCRRPECREANRVYMAARNRRIAYGHPTSEFVDATPVREHVRALQAAGMGYARVARAAGVSSSTLGRVLGYEGRPTMRIKAASAARVLAVELDIAPGGCVDATGTVRRLRGLAALGWSQRRLAVELGWAHHTEIHNLLSGQEFVERATADLVAVAYDRLWATTPPAGTRADRAAATAVRRSAARKGWVVPMAWDDDQLDDPTAVPDMGEEPSTTRRVEPEAVEWLRSFGMSDELIAQRLRVAPQSIVTAMRRHEEAAA